MKLVHAVPIVLVALAGGCASLFGGELEKGLEKLGKSAEEGLAKALKPLAELDPLQLRHLIETNEGLREQLRLARDLQNLGWSVRPQDDAQIEVVECRGRFRVQVRIDSEENWITDTHVGHGGVFAPQVGPMATSLKAFLERQWIAIPGPDAVEENNRAYCSALANVHQGAAELAGVVRGQVEAYLASFTYTAMGPTTLRPKTRQAGEHKIICVVTPVEEDSGSWSIKIRFTIRRGGSSQNEEIGSFSFAKDGISQLAAPLPPREFKLVFD